MTPTRWTSWCGRLAAGSALALCVGLPPASAQDKLPEPAKAEAKADAKKDAAKYAFAVPAGARPITLAEALAVARQVQPSVKAARISLATAVARKKSVDDIRVPEFLQRDLPVRRQQACVGLAAAVAAARQAELTTDYAVKFGYVSYLFARTQLAVADDSAERLRDLHEKMAAVIKGADDPKSETKTDLRRQDRDRIGALVKLAEARREEAEAGALRALSALREAIGLPPCEKVFPVEDRMPDVTVVLDGDSLVAQAVAFRGELAQAATAAAVTDLEIVAQEVRRRALRVNTFASGSDIHATPLPAGSYDERYSPAALGPEMPVTINGKVADRVAQAKLYATRAHVVAEKTRLLVTLDVEQAYLRAVEASKRIPKLMEGAKLADASLAEIRKGITDLSEDKSKIDELITTGLISSQLTVGLNEARYQLLLSLAALERASGGAFCAGLERSGTAVAPSDGKTPPAKDDKKDPTDSKFPPDKTPAEPLAAPRTETTTPRN